METEERKWTEKERGLLLKGIAEYGIGHFSEISMELLPEWVCAAPQYDVLQRLIAVLL
jgi:hypothetical protein